MYLLQSIVGRCFWLRLICSARSLSAPIRTFPLSGFFSLLDKFLRLSAPACSFRTIILILFYLRPGVVDGSFVYILLPIVSSAMRSFSCDLLRSTYIYIYLFAQMWCLQPHWRDSNFFSCLHIFFCLAVRVSLVVKEGQYPVRWTAQSALHVLPSLIDLFIAIPTRLLREAF